MPTPSARTRSHAIWPARPTRPSPSCSTPTLLHPDAGRLVFGHKGRPELGSGVLERVMRELNRRTDVGVRWSIDGLRRLLMIKLQHKYHQGPWSPSVTAPPTPTVRFSLAA